MFLERLARQDNQKASPRIRIAVIGAGPAGLATVIALMNRLHRPFEASLIDAGDAPGSFGEGPAGEALMNEPAGDMSVVANRPDDFVDWLNGSLLSAGSISALRGPRDMHVPRAVFRDYLIARFSQSLDIRRDVSIRTVQACVRRVDRDAGSVRVTYEDGDSADFDHVYVATGLGPIGRESETWQAARNTADRLARLDNPPPMTLVGDGPRLASLLLDLRNRGYRGEIRLSGVTTAVAQERGRGHDRTTFGVPPASRSLLAALRYIRQECRAAEAAEDGQWQSVVDAATARLSVVWRNLPQAERNRYRRRLLRLHRHFAVRLPRELHHRLRVELQSGRTRVVALRGEISGENVFDCRETPSAAALARLLGLDADRLTVDDCGRLIDDRGCLPGLAVIGTAASALRPGPFVFAETVRQAYRAVLDLQPRSLGRVDTA
jgi:uncharacterized NAD(P)/FAD-binding protein YdhS